MLRSGITALLQMTILRFLESVKFQNVNGDRIHHPSSSELYSVHGLCNCGQNQSKTNRHLDLHGWGVVLDSYQGLALSYNSNCTLVASRPRAIIELYEVLDVDSALKLTFGSIAGLDLLVVKTMKGRCSSAACSRQNTIAWFAIHVRL